MKQISELSEAAIGGGASRDKPRHPTMRPTNSNAKAMSVVEREIRDLELHLEGRAADQDGDGGGGIRRGGEEKVRSACPPPTGREQHDRAGGAGQGGSGAGEGKAEHPVLEIPDTPERGGVDSAPSNEREARLRKRMMDRKQNQKSKAGPEGPEVAPRPAFTPSHKGGRPGSSVHQRAAKSSASQHKLYADRAWGEVRSVEGWSETTVGYSGAISNVTNTHSFPTSLTRFARRSTGSVCQASRASSTTTSRGSCSRSGRRLPPSGRGRRKKRQGRCERIKSSPSRREKKR